MSAEEAKGKYSFASLFLDAPKMPPKRGSCLLEALSGAGINGCPVGSESSRVDRAAMVGSQIQNQADIMTPVLPGPAMRELPKEVPPARLRV